MQLFRKKIMDILSSDKVNKLRENTRSIVRELGLLNDAYFEIGVTLAERHLLIELATCKQPTVGEIAERLLLDKSTVSRLISKAVKKQYVSCSADKKDKRKRFLKFTKQGEKILNTFEPIAFNQTKKALETLTPSEIEKIYQGIALYAQGLKNARGQNKKLVCEKLSSEHTKEKTISIESLQKIHEQLGKQGYSLSPFQGSDENSLYEIFQEIVSSGKEFPYEDSSKEEFHKQFLNPSFHVYTCRFLNGEVVGGFYIKANFSGRSSHIANAAYMIKRSHRGKGIGTLLIKASLHISKKLGFHAMQYNMVLSCNAIAIAVYLKLGFKIIATLPSAIRNSDRSYQDGYVFFRKLDEE